jgi:WD40 repeat protein
MLVLEFSQLLRDCGVDAELDLWADDGRRDWSDWAAKQLRDSDFTLVVASSAYKRRAEGTASPEEGRGSKYEAGLIRDKLTQDRDVWVARILPVVLPGCSVEDIPDFLQPYAGTRYEITSITRAGIEDLLRALTGQARHVRPPLGDPIRLPPHAQAGLPQPHWHLRHDADLRGHWLPRARGVEPDAGESGWYFVGRRKALGELADWLATPAREANDRRMRVVTGSPGSGKSSVLAHLVVLADTGMRDHVPDVYKRDHPRGLIGSVDVAVHARDKDTAAVVREIAAAAGVKASTPIDLLVALSDRGGPFTIVLDALDEALPDQIPHLARMLNRLARDPDGVGIRVLVAVRRALDGSPLAAAARELGSRAVVMPVDMEPYLDPADVVTYVRRRLLLDGHVDGASPRPADMARAGRARTPYRGAPELAARVARAVAERSRGNFLVAQLVSRFLAEDPAPVDVSQDGWSAQFPETVDTAVAETIARFGGLDRQQWVRDLLTPLAFGTGQGLPDNQLWASLATALSRPQRTYRPADVHQLMDTAATYLVDRSTVRERRAYRLYHSAMDQYLREQCRVTDPASVIATTLAGCIPVRGDDSRDWRAADPYLRAHLAEHAARAGAAELERLLSDPPFLAYGDPAGLVRVLSRAPAASRGTARVYQVAAHNLEGSPGERAAYLALVAHQLGETRLAAGLEKVPDAAPWSVTACHWTPPDDYQVILTLDGTTTATALASRRPGRVLVVAGDSAGRVQLTRWADGIAEPDDAHDGHPGAVTAIAVRPAPDGRLTVVTGCRDGGLRLWHVDDDLLIPVSPVLAGAHQDAVTAIAFGSGSAGHEVALTADRSGGLRLWRVSGEELVRYWSASSGTQLTAVGLFRDPGGRECVISGGEDGFRLWRPRPSPGVAEYDALKSPPRASRIIGAIAMQARGDRAAVFIGTGNGHLHRIWIDAGGALPSAMDFEAMDSGISALEMPSLASSRQDEIFAIGSADGDVTLIHNPEGGSITEGELNLHQQVRAHEGRVRSILLNGDVHGGLTVTSSADDHQVISWTASREAQPLTGMWDARKSGITVAATCGDGPYRALTLLNREERGGLGVEFWAFDGSSFTDLSEADSSSGEVRPVTVALTFEGMHTSQRPTGSQWFAGTTGNAHMIGNSAMAMRYVDGRYVVIRAAPHGELVLAECSLRELETRTYEAVRPETFPGQEWVESMAISHDARRRLLATGAATGTLDLWAIEGRTLGRLSQPGELSQPGPRLDFVHLPDGELRLLVGDSLGTLGLLTVAGNRILPGGERWHAQEQPITAVAATVDAQGHVIVLAGDISGLVTLWRFASAGIPAEPAMRVRLGSRVVSLAFSAPNIFIAWCKQGAAVIRWNTG